MNTLSYHDQYIYTCITNTTKLKCDFFLPSSPKQVLGNCIDLKIKLITAWGPKQNMGHLRFLLRTAATATTRSLYLKWPKICRLCDIPELILFTFITAVRQALPRAALFSPLLVKGGVYPCPSLPFSLLKPPPSKNDWSDLQNKKQSRAYRYI